MAKATETVLMPTEVSSRVGFFDRFAGSASHVASRATFFAFCVLLILLWAPSIVFIGNVDTWQLIINTATTCITFLLVALLQNSQTRSDQAVQHKLNAIADGLADVMAHLAGDDGDEERDLKQDEKELRAAVGLEEQESTSNNRGPSTSSGEGSERATSNGSRKG
jgi:low affinity Fe/Cu permease